MDDLIKREAVLDYMKGWKGDTVNFVRNLPAVEAVPLDKLCEWLQENASLKNGTLISAVGWNYALTKWMEEQDAQKKLKPSPSVTTCIPLPFAPCGMRWGDEPTCRGW